jgi:ribosomal protein S12 methylthiotransferase
MRRGLDENKTVMLIKKIRDSVPEVAIRTTFILGYPGETDKDFKKLKNFVEQTRFERLGCFKYSHEENTHAYNLVDNVSEEIKQKRINEIMKIQSRISRDKNQNLIGKVLKCVIDRKEGEFYIGRTEYDSPDVDNEVLVDAKKNYMKIGDFSNLKITSANDYDLVGEPL